MTQKKMHPRQDFKRTEWKNLNGRWEFSFDKPVFDRFIHVPFPWGSPLSGVEDSRDCTAFYRKQVKWNPDGQRIFIIFGAVDYTCTVSVNGKTAGSHKGGYSQFEFDITELWNRLEINTITVEARDTAEQCQTYGKQGYGDARGIWQTVYLEARPESYIEKFRFITKTDGTVTCSLSSTGCSDGDSLRMYVRKINSIAGIPATRFDFTVKDNKAEAVFKIDNPCLWDIDRPNLYSVKMVLTHGDTRDTVYSYFGIREIGTGVFGKNKTRFITLNGNPVYINGVLDQSYNPMGFFTLPSDKDCEDEVLRLKNIGINTARIHIKAEEPLKLYYADMHGLLIMADFPCFWGQPNEATRVQFETEYREQIARDFNHPSVFYWVIFNETWGLKSAVRDEEGKEKPNWEYTDETAKWVVKCYNDVKSLDPTRLVEDNSVCLADHTETDVNTWHFYTNGYERVRNEIRSFCEKCYEGSPFNYKKGFVMKDVPLMNSECGNYWGIEGNAGESDISWQYKYMINEFRNSGKLSGFIFTEFHDVINEFNGIYKIDNSTKNFGYEFYGSKLKYLHSQDYVGADFPPVSVFHSGDRVKIPLFCSSFSDRYRGSVLKLFWELKLIDGISGNRVVNAGSFGIHWGDYGRFDGGLIAFKVPSHNGPAVLSWKLSTDSPDSEIIMSDFICFDFYDSDSDKSVLVCKPSDLTAEGWNQVISLDSPEKISGLGSGSFSLVINPADIPEIDRTGHVEIFFEASTRFPMDHDYPDSSQEKFGDLMLGYKVNPGKNKNSFPQTDESTFMGTVKVSVNGTGYGLLKLPDCPADSRGMLSYLYQKDDVHLSEAGSYGYLCRLSVPVEEFYEKPSRVKTPKKPNLKKSVTVSFSSDTNSGLSIFGRKAGMYGLGIVFSAISNRE